MPPTVTGSPAGCTGCSGTTTGTSASTRSPCWQRIPCTARALSASLAALARADDAQTVRQAVVALGAVGARWAGPVVAGCLDHPVMNVKKAAAEALATTGTPAEVPALLGWLGRHDNPGLRESVRSALRAILGDAYVATVLAAAERATDDRTRDLLLTSLDGQLTATAVHAIAEHRSSVAPAMLAMLADGRIGLRRPGDALAAGSPTASAPAGPRAHAAGRNRPGGGAAERRHRHARRARVAARTGRARRRHVR